MTKKPLLVRGFWNDGSTYSHVDPSLLPISKNIVIVSYLS
jgi:hypothetical protein